MALSAMCPDPQPDTAPVSYTHLDVYKRQGRAYEVVEEAVKQPGYGMWQEYCYPAILYEYLEYIVEDAVKDYNSLSAG